MGSQIVDYFASGVGAIAAYLPNLVSAVVILLVGYGLARLLGGLTRRLLMRAHFDEFMARRLHPRAGEQHLSKTLGTAVFWVGMLVTFSLGARALRLATLSDGIDRIIAYVPRVLVAAAIVAIAVAVANVLANLVGNMTKAEWLPKALRFAVVAFAVFMALDELQIARSIVNAAFIALVGASAVAAAIAFGVGNIDLAREYGRRWQRPPRAHTEVLTERMTGDAKATPVAEKPMAPEKPETPKHVH